MNKKETKEEGKKLFMTGDEFINFLDDVMCGEYKYSKSDLCIRQRWLSKEQWRQLMSEWVDDDEWEEKYESEWDSLFDDGGLTEEEFYSEVVDAATSIAGSIDYTLPTDGGVLVATKCYQKFEVYFLDD